MRVSRIVVVSVVASVAVVLSTVARAQTGPAASTPLQTAIACAVQPTSTPAPAGALRIAGAQDTTRRMIYQPTDRLVIGGATATNVQIGEEFFVRRPESFGAEKADRVAVVRTVGWIKIVAANDRTAIAAVEHACTALAEGDYLEPFVAPVVPANADRVDTSGDLDFGSLGRVLYGDHVRLNAGIGDFMLIDRGADAGATPGSRFAVYRDLRTGGLPLAAVGEAVVVSAGPSLAVVRITQARDAITAGDFVVPRR